MENVELYISNLIQNQFPSFYKSEGPMLIAFVQAYYEWLELNSWVDSTGTTQTGGQTLYNSRRLLDYSDIDNTVDQFLVYFKNTYLQGMQFNTETDKRLVVKRVLDLYRTKGSPRAIQLLFKLLFAEDVTLYYPGQNVFKTSDNKWVVPQYLEVTYVPNLNQYVGQEIVGVNSGATAFVDSVVTGGVSSKYVNIFYLSNIKNNFVTGELVTLASNPVTSNVPTVVGSATSLQIVSGGAGFSVGNIVDLIPQQTTFSGSGGKAVVANISNISGTTTYTLTDGGFGYNAITSNLIVSSNVVFLTNVQVNNTTLNIAPYGPLEKLTFSNSTGGTITANAVGVSSNTILYVNNVNGTFSAQESLSVGGNATAVLSYSSTANATTQVLTTTKRSGVFITGQTVKGLSSGATATLASYNMYVGINNLSDSINATQFTKVVGYNPPLLINANSAVSNSGTSSARILAANPYSNGQALFYTNSVGATAIGGLANGTTYYATYVNTSGFSLSSSSGGANITFYANSTSNSVSFAPNVATIATVNAVMYGQSSNVKIVSVTNTDSNFWVATDSIATYANTKLNAAAYAFPANASTNATNYSISTALAFGKYSNSVGFITQIQTTSPGYSYSYPPFVLAQANTGVTQLYEKDYIMSVNAAASAFKVGDYLYQNVAATNSVTLAVNGTTGFGYSRAVYQSNGSYTCANGVIIDIPDTTHIAIKTTSGGFTTNSSFILYDNSTKNAATVSTINSTAYAFVAKGVVTAGSGNTIYVERLSAQQSFVANSSIPLTNNTQGSSFQIYTVASNPNRQISGLNAVITSAIQTGNGSVTQLTLIDSGFGYTNTALVNFVSESNASAVGVASVVTSTQGKSLGYYKYNNSFLDSNQYVQDGYYYQPFSYEIQSSLDLSVYSDVVKKVVHIAGTQMFGSVHKTASIDIGQYSGAGVPSITLS